jgi:hypothetical protein
MIEVLVDLEDIAEVVGRRVQRPVQGRQGFADDIDDRAVNARDMADGPGSGMDERLSHRSLRVAQPV